jgi:hypothetical protein
MTFTKLINNHVIFAIDNDKDLHTVAKFTRFVDTQRALGALHYNPQIGIGSYESELEQCYMMDYNDYYGLVAESGYVDGQDSVLVLNPRSPRSSAFQGILEYSNGDSEYLGIWTDVSEDAWKFLEAYTVINGRTYACV